MAKPGGSVRPLGRRRRQEEEMKMRSNRGMTGIEVGEKRDLGWISNAETTRSLNFSNVDVTLIFH